MIPEDIEQFTTDGEEQVYNFLETVAKPGADYTVWYSPDIRGRDVTLPRNSTSTNWSSPA